MRPQHASPALHLLLQHAQLKVPLAALALVNVLLKALQPLVDLRVLLDQVAVLGVKLGHPLGQHGEEVRLLDAVVHGEVLGEFGADLEELLEGHALGAAASGAGLPEDVP